MGYVCSVCQQKVIGDLVFFQNHTDKHIVDLVKKDHPEWASSDGMCQKCYEYYKSEIDGSFFKDAECASRNRAVKGFMGKIAAFFKKK